MKTSLLELLFGCWHSNYTFPIKDVATGLHHVTCLECGKESYYSWERMKPISDNEAWGEVIQGMRERCADQISIDMAVERILAK